MTRKFLLPILVNLLVIISLLAPRTTNAMEVAIKDLPQPLFVSNQELDLQSIGCHTLSANPETHRVNLPPGNLIHVVPSDWNKKNIFFCDISSRSSLLPLETTNSTQTPLLGANTAEAGIFASITSGIGAVVKGLLNSVLGIISPVLMIIIEIFSGVGRFVIGQATLLIGPLLGASVFIRHPMVSVGWPFIQGIANIGFILALLFIAAATTLRLENYGIRRLLPRLLIAALLLNFSLVIGGLMIDASRVVMAAMIALMFPAGAQVTINDIGIVALDASKFIKMVEGLSSTTMSWWPNPGSLGAFAGGDADTLGVNNFERLTTSLTQVLVTWIFAGALLIMAVQLFLRYVVLILLLIVSPLAYLAFAFPMAESLAKRWWETFLKYVLYGPVVTFMLALLVTISNLNKDFPTTSDNFLYGMLNLGVTATVIVAAALFGKQLGLVGASATVGFVSNRGRRLAGQTFGVAKTVSGLGFLEKQAKRPFYAGREFVQDFRNKQIKRARSGKYYGDTTPLQKGASKAIQIIAGPDRDEKGNLKPGESSPGGSLGSYLGSSPEDRVKLNDARKLKKDYETGAYKPQPSDISKDKRLASERLIDPDIAVKLPPGLIKQIYEHGAPEQKNALSAGLSKAPSISREQITAVVDAAQPDPVTGTLNQDNVKGLRSIVNNVHIVNKMKDEHVANILKIDDDKLQDTFRRALGRSQDRK